LRHDWGSQYTANTFVNEIKWWGLPAAPAFVGEPECNGCAERFMRTLKEQCLYLHQFRDLEEAREIIGAFIARYNAEWIVERLGYRTPAQARRDALREAAWGGTSLSARSRDGAHIRSPCVAARQGPHQAALVSKKPATLHPSPGRSTQRRSTSCRTPWTGSIGTQSSCAGIWGRPFSSSNRSRVRDCSWQA